MKKTEIISQIGFAQLNDLPCLKLHFGEASAVVSLYGGQVLSYQPTPDHEILWVSGEAEWHNGAAIRGGVPVCWPWFGPADSKINPEKQSLPNHGLVRNRLWQLQHSETSALATCVTLSIAINDLPAALSPQTTTFQHSATLNLSIRLNARELSMQLSCTTPLYQQAALHSYFKVNDVTQSWVSGLSPQYYDKVSGSEQHCDSHQARFAAETDRIYRNTGSTLQLKQAEQQLTINQQGHDASVIWNPWQQKSRELPDMADHGFIEFICVESARLDLTTTDALCLSQTLIPG